MSGSEEAAGSPAYAGAPPLERERRPVSRTGLARAGRKLLLAVSLAFVAASAYVEVRMGFVHEVVGFDFEGTLWDPANAIRHGQSPYPPPTVSAVEVGNPALYPPLLMLGVLPLTWLPWPLGVGVWVLVLVAAVAGSLAALGVRDLRVYLLALLALPVVNGLVLGNATLVLLLPVALAWRWRDRWAWTGAAVGVALAAKLFLWPLAFWLLGTRRYRALAVALATAAGAVLLPWAAIGFDGLRSYPHLLRAAEDVYAGHSYSLATALAALGVDAGMASRALVSLGFLAALGVAAVARRSPELAAFSLAVLVAVLASPIVWPYYYALLVVPLAVLRPAPALAWLLLASFYVTQELPRPLLGWDDLAPGGVACCPPADTPLTPWALNHAPPGLWPALGHAVVAIVVSAIVVGTAFQGARDGRSPRVRWRRVPNA